MKLIISSHNKQILTLRNKQVGYNCRVRNCCPLDNKCTIWQLIYQADITNSLDDEYKYYQGLAEKLLKNDIATIKVCLKIKAVKTI